MTPPITPSYAGHRFPPEVISHAVWPYFRFPLGLRMLEEMLAARGITVTHETIRQWALKFGQTFAGVPRSTTARHSSHLQPRGSSRAAVVRWGRHADPDSNRWGDWGSRPGRRLLHPGWWSV